jgi:hypothetical protein
MPIDVDVHSVSVDLPSACGPDCGGFNMAVPGHVVSYTIDVLRCIVTQWQPPEGLEPEAQAANRVMTATCQVAAVPMRYTIQYRVIGDKPDRREWI